MTRVDDRSPIHVGLRVFRAIEQALSAMSVAPGGGVDHRPDSRSPGAVGGKQTRHLAVRGANIHGIARDQVRDPAMIAPPATSERNQSKSLRGEIRMEVVKQRTAAVDGCEPHFRLDQKVHNAADELSAEIHREVRGCEQL